MCTIDYDVHMIDGDALLIDDLPHETYVPLHVTDDNCAGSNIPVSTALASSMPLFVAAERMGRRI